jgi:hypothetical protein
MMRAKISDVPIHPAIDAIEDAINQVVEVCINVRRFRLPVVVVAVSTDGCVFAFRFEETSEGAEPAPIFMHRSGAAAFKFPVNLMVCDSADSTAAQAVIRSGTIKPEFVH